MPGFPPPFAPPPPTPHTWEKERCSDRLAPSSVLCLKPRFGKVDLSWYRWFRLVTFIVGRAVRPGRSRPSITSTPQTPTTLWNRNTTTPPPPTPTPPTPHRLSLPPPPTCNYRRAATGATTFYYARRSPRSPPKSSESLGRFTLILPQ